MKHTMKSKKTRPNTANTPTAEAMKKKWAAYSHLFDDNSRTQLERQVAMRTGEEKLPPGLNEEELKTRKVKYEGEIKAAMGETKVYLFTIVSSNDDERTSITVKTIEGKDILTALDKKLQTLSV